MYNSFKKLFANFLTKKPIATKVQKKFFYFIDVSCKKSNIKLYCLFSNTRLKFTRSKYLDKSYILIEINNKNTALNNKIIFYIKYKEYKINREACFHSGKCTHVYYFARLDDQGCLRLFLLIDVFIHRRFSIPLRALWRLYLRANGIPFDQSAHSITPCHRTSFTEI